MQKAEAVRFGQGGEHLADEPDCAGGGERRFGADEIRQRATGDELEGDVEQAVGFFTVVVQRHHRGVTQGGDDLRFAEEARANLRVDRVAPPDDLERDLPADGLLHGAVHGAEAALAEHADHRELAADDPPEQRVVGSGLGVAREDEHRAVRRAPRPEAGGGHLMTTEAAAHLGAAEGTAHRKLR